MMRSSSSSLDYNSPNRDSSYKLSSSPIRERPRDRHQVNHGNTTTTFSETLDHRHHQSLSHQSNQPRRENTTTTTNNNNNIPDPNPNPDPIAAASPTTSLITPVNVVNAASSSSSLVRYRECLKNHAASSGGHVLDGCGEFMPSGEDGTAEAMKCAACECHRNFHRQEIDGESQYNLPNIKLSRNGNYNNSNSVVLHQQHYHPPPPPPPTTQSNHNPYLHHHRQYQRPDRYLLPVHHHRPIATPVMMTFGGSESSSEDLNMFDHDHVSKAGVTSMAHRQASGGSGASKKRFRTKFNQKQKDKMMEFAEKLGWRIQKHDDQEVQRFCSEVGVKRQVFKVWMHNNKQAMKKKNQV